MDEVMIWTPEGCWYQRTMNGVTRCSFMGDLGTIDEVAERCKEQAMRFEKFADTFDDARSLEKARANRALRTWAKGV